MTYEDGKAEKNTLRTIPPRAGCVGMTAARLAGFDVFKISRLQSIREYYRV